MLQNDVLKAILQGTPPRAIRLAAARGTLPLLPQESLLLLVHLLNDADQEIADGARTTLASYSEDEILAQIVSRECPIPVLEHFAQSTRSARIQEEIIRNPSTPAATIAALAQSAAAPLVDAILLNRARLVESPEILDNLKRNPELTPEATRLISEIDAEFFSGKKTDYAIEESAAVETAEPEPEEAGPAELPDELSLEHLPVDAQAEEGSLLERISRMTVRQKIQEALLGTREARAMLIRDTNKDVSRSVLQSPKLTDKEVEAFSAMRNISEDILRQIGTSKKWIRSYGVIQNLVRNPKTPAMIAQRMLGRLQSRDLQLLAKDRGIPEAVRRMAQRTFVQRTSGNQKK